MKDIWILAILCIVSSGGFLWYLFRVYFPLKELSRLAKREVEHGGVQRWEIDGIGSIRSIAKSLSRSSSHATKLKAFQERSETEMKGLLRGLEEGAAVIGENGIVRMANPSFFKLFGLEGKEDGKRLIDLIRVYEVNQLVSHVLEEQELTSEEISFQIISGDQLNTRFYKLTCSPLRDSQGKAFGVLLIVGDHTELKRMEALERQLIANVSHELRTPLAVFKGYLEALTDLEAKGKPQTQRMLGVLTRHSNRLNHLIEDLLVLSQIEDGSIKPKLEPIRIHAFFDRLRQDAEQLIGKGGGEIRCHVPDDIEVVTMDEFRMEQVFHNLVDNALRHAETDSPIDLGLKLEERSKELHFYVKDQGVGIPSDKLQLIFTRFYRVDRARSRERGGTGLGLAIVNQIIEAHGGKAWAESSLGEGTTIWFSLPFRPIDSIEQESRDPEHQPTSH
ncbi:MAG: ATP-binding protein [Verrucomicrobiota bacterium]